MIARPVEKIERNREMLRAVLNGSTMRHISKEYGLSYDRCREVILEQKRKLLKRFETGETIELLAKEHLISVTDAQRCIDDVARRRTQQKERWEAEDARRVSEYDEYLRESYRGDLRDHWKAISNCPPYVVYAILYCEGQVCIGLRSSAHEAWKANGTNVSPSHWMQITSPKESSQ